MFKLLEKHEANFPKTSITLNVATLGLFAFCFLLLALNAGKGFDITDRSFYLLWAVQPEKVTGAVGHFGFITGIIYEMTGKSIVAFRLSGLLLLLPVGTIFSHSFKRYLDEKSLVTNINFFTFGLIFSVGILFGYNGWFHSPSYNWLALVASVTVITGLLYFSVAVHDKILTHISSILVATGGVLAYIAKPTTAMALAFISTFWVATEGINKRSLTFFLSAAALASLLLFLYIYVFFGSIGLYYDNFKLGLELSNLIGAGHNVSEIISKPVNQTFDFFKWWLKVPFVQFFAAAAAAGLVITFYKTKFRSYFFLFLAFIIFSAFCVFTYYFYELHRNIYASTTLLSVIGCGFIAYVAVVLIEELRPGKVKIDRKLLIKGFFAALLFFLAAYAPSLGTNNRILPHISHSLVFLTGSLLILVNLISPQDGKKIIFSAFGLVLSILLTIFLVKAYEKPYRLVGSISNQTVQVNFLNPTHKVYVDPITAQYVKDLKLSANNAGWERGTPLIDMTGGSPGALVVLDARIVGVPWLLGAYEGSNAFVEKALNSEDQEILEKAWVLTAPYGRRQINEEILRNLGLKFPDQYGLVGIMKTGHRNETQKLWKPGSGVNLELKSIAKQSLALSGPPHTIHSEQLTEDVAEKYGWMNAGWRGEILVSGVKDDPGVMRLEAGKTGKEYDGRGGHVLLLRPVEKHERGLPPDPQAQFVRFGLDMRAENLEISGRVRLRLDAITPSGWRHAIVQRWVKLSNEWAKQEIMLKLEDEYLAIEPKIAWEPAVEGGVLQLRKPSLDWVQLQQFPLVDRSL